MSNLIIIIVEYWLVLFIFSYPISQTFSKMKVILCWRVWCKFHPIFADHSCRWVHRSRGSCLAYETLCLFWVWSATRRTTLHYAGWQTLLPTLLWCHVCRILWLVWGTHWRRSRYSLYQKMKILPFFHVKWTPCCHSMLLIKVAERIMFVSCNQELPRTNFDQYTTCWLGFFIAFLGHTKQLSEFAPS